MEWDGKSDAARDESTVDMFWLVACLSDQWPFNQYYLERENKDRIMEIITKQFSMDIGNGVISADI